MKRNDLSMKPLVWVAAAFSMLIAYGAQAGNSSGGGGKGVACRNADQSTKSVEILDLWEGRALRGLVPQPVSGNLAADVDVLLNRLKASISLPMYAFDDKHKKICENQDCHLLALREYALQFLDENNKNIKRLRDVTLEPTNDSLELAQPKDCAIEQIVNYQPDGGPILLNQDLFDKMDAANKAALIAHEAYYKYLKFLFNEENSVRARRAIGYVASGHDLIAPPKLPWKKGQIVCLTMPQTDANPQPTFRTLPVNALVFDSDFKRVDFRVVGGATLLGLSPELGVPSVVDIMTKVVKQKSCEVGTAKWNLLGPVEYDRGFQLTPSCQSGKPKLFLSVRNPGRADVSTWPLKCAPLTKPLKI